MQRMGAWATVGLLLAVTASANAQDNSQLESIKIQADAAYRERNFSRTVELADQALTQSPQDHVALYLRGSARVEMGIQSRNLEMIRTGISDAREAIRHEGNGQPDYYLPYIYGMSHLSQIEGKPTHARTALTVADSVLEREDLTSDQRANLLYQRAQAQLQLKNYPAAEADLQNVLKQSPTHLAALMLQADIAARTKSPAEGLAAYSRLVQAHADNPLMYNNRGMYLQSLGRTQEAVNDFNKALELDPRFFPAYLNRGYAYLEAGDAATAEKVLTQALQVEPTQTAAISLRGTARLNQNKSAEAVNDYRQVVQLAPRNAMSHADLGFAQFFLADFPSALASFKKALELDPSIRFLLPWRLACESRLGSVDPNAYAATANKAESQRDWIDLLILFGLNKLDAKTLLDSIHPTDDAVRQAQLCEAYYFIGVELQRRGQGQNALSYFQQATQKKLPKLSAYRGALFAMNNKESVAR